jgi:ABC-2 type transport system ATP-binding protein
VIEVHARRREDLTKVADGLGRLAHGQPQIDESTRRVSVGVTSEGEGLLTALRSVQAAGAKIEDIALRQPNLDEVFLALTGQPPADAPSAHAGRATRKDHP